VYYGGAIGASPSGSGKFIRSLKQILLSWMKRASFLALLLFTALSSALADSSRLPDGTEFPTWEKPLQFTKTYYVDGNAKNALDSGPGTKERPFRTIDHAAQVLQPGEHVVIASGAPFRIIRVEFNTQGSSEH